LLGTQARAWRKISRNPDFVEIIALCNLTAWSDEAWKGCGHEIRVLCKHRFKSWKLNGKKFHFGIGRFKLRQDFTWPERRACHFALKSQKQHDFSAVLSKPASAFRCCRTRDFI